MVDLDETRSVVRNNLATVEALLNELTGKLHNSEQDAKHLRKRLDIAGADNTSIANALQETRTKLEEAEKRIEHNSKELDLLYTELRLERSARVVVPKKRTPKYELVKPFKVLSNKRISEMRMRDLRAYAERVTDAVTALAHKVQSVDGDNAKIIADYHETLVRLEAAGWPCCLVELPDLYIKIGRELEEARQKIKALTSFVDQPKIAPGDHVEYEFHRGEVRTGIVLKVFTNGRHGEWCHIWCTRDDSQVSMPLSNPHWNREVKRIPGPRGV